MNIRVQKKIIFCWVILLMSSSFAFADDDRHLAVDQAIGGMEQGSRIGAPGSTPIPITDAHKTIFSPLGIKKAEPSPVTVGENHGNIYSASAQINNPVNPVTTGSESATPEQIIHPIDTGGSQPEAEPITNPIDSGAGTGTPTEEPSNPIVDVGASADLESGTVEADATVDTTGELEEKQIFEADLEAEGVGSLDADVSSAAESNPIVDTQVSADLESGKVEADATVDTSGDLEEKQILDADLGTGETTTEAEVGSATDVTQSDTVESTDITTQPVSTVTTTSDLTAEIDTTGETTGGEADVGVEADVSGVSEAEDVTCDPADGLTSSACGLPQL